MAVIGIRGQGNGHIGKWLALKENRNVFLKTICDTDENLFGERVKRIEEETGHRPVTEWDMKKDIEDKDIDAVSFATPNHWHALGSIWGCQAGKHVYVEKPATHNVYEGRKMIEAARKYDRRVQDGCQNRSFANVIEAVKLPPHAGTGSFYWSRG